MDDSRLRADRPIGQTLLAAVLAAHRQHQLFPAPAPGRLTAVVVGVSGGADSVALLHSLLQLRQELQLELHVAHLDHQLRPESDQEAAFVAQLAKQWGLPCYQQRLAPGALVQQSGGVEDAGRQARYTFFARVAINVTPSTEVPCVVLAHHADDQAETVLFHLLRGSGLRGLGGMRWVQALALHPWSTDPTLANVTLRVVRPLLGVRKTELVNYLQAHQLPWQEDPSNQSAAFVRNRLRHEVLPLLATLNPGIVATLGRTAITLAAESERAEQIDQQALASLRQAPDPAAAGERVVLDLMGLCQQDQATQRGVLRLALGQLLPTANPTFDQIEQILAGISTPIRTRGPHPLQAGIAWSVVGPTASQPAWLSLHRPDALPLQPDQPYLPTAWRQTVAAWPVVAGGQLPLPNGWVLHSRLLALAHLPADWRQPGHPWRVYLAADRLANAVLTAPRPGLKFAPLGLAGQHKNVGDFFTDHKVTPALRPGWPILIDRVSHAVLWVCGLAIAHSARLTEQTEQVVELAWRRDYSGNGG